jgi:hypothetical protein
MEMALKRYQVSNRHMAFCGDIINPANTPKITPNVEGIRQHHPASARGLVTTILIAMQKLLAKMQTATISRNV